jgi:hypothetical protein
MADQIVTSDIKILTRIGKYSKLNLPEPESPTPKTCPICQQKMYPKLIHRKIIYIGCSCRNARPYKFSPPEK